MPTYFTFHNPTGSRFAPLEKRPATKAQAQRQVNELAKQYMAHLLLGETAQEALRNRKYRKRRMIELGAPRDLVKTEEEAIRVVQEIIDKGETQVLEEIRQRAMAARTVCKRLQ